MLRDAAILVRDGSIADVGSRALERARGETVLDCSGAVVAAGFWNCHVHFHERKWANVAEIPAAELERQLRELTRYGFTSVFDLSSPWSNTRALRDRIESGEVAGPRVYSTGEGLIPLGGRPSAEAFRMLGLVETALPEVASFGDARDAARELLVAGVDGIKLFVSAPPAEALSPDAIRAACDEAHRAGKPAFAHPNTAADVFAALDGGVDIVAHTTPRSGPWDEDVLEALSAHGAALIPTLMVWESMMRHDRISVRENAVATSVGQLRAWLERDGELLFGTDLGAVEPDPAREYALMRDAGATFEQILASLTTSPARRFAAPAHTGRVAAGSPADLVVLEGDPAEDLARLTSVRYTIRNGSVIYRAA